MKRKILLLTALLCLQGTFFVSAAELTDGGECVSEDEVFEENLEVLEDGEENSFVEESEEDISLFYEEESSADEIANEIANEVANESYSVSINKENFPDKNFREFICTYDLDKDGILSEEETSCITEIDLSYKQVENMKGLEYFPNLVSLNCMCTRISGKLDIAELGLYKLKSLNCSQTLIKTLSGIEKLEELDCSGCDIEVLDVRKVKNLKMLNCQGSRYLKSLRVDGLDKLEILDCSDNNLKSLNLTGLENLKILNCSSDNLKSLKLNNLRHLEVLSCIYNELTELNVQNLKELKVISCSDNKITELDFTNLSNLKEIYCDTNKIEKLLLEGTSSLETLTCNDNELYALDVTDLKQLRSINCVNNYIHGDYFIKGLDRSITRDIWYSTNKSRVPFKPALKKAYNSRDGIWIKWNCMMDAKYYIIMRKEANNEPGNTWQEVKQVKGNQDSFLDTSVKNKNGVSYIYTVRGSNPAHLGPYNANGRRISRLGTPGLTGVYNSKEGALIKWNKIKGADGYHIYRKQNTEDWTKIGSVKGADTLQFKDLSVKNHDGNYYSYTVKAFRGDSLSAWNGVGKTLLRVKNPVITSCVNWSGRKINVKWKRDPLADGYEIQYSTSSKFTWKKGVKADSNIDNQRIYNLTKGKMYYVRIRSYRQTDNGVYYSTWSVKNVRIIK